jgi:hypothetical protein
MKPMRTLLAAGMTAAVMLSTAAGPAAAKKAPDPDSFTYFATIDCGAGPVEVGSGDDLWSPLVDLKTGKRYTVVAWHVSGDGFAVDEARKGSGKKHATDCDYSDGVATGTVTVKKA